MKRRFLPIEALPAWAKLNGISFHNIEIKRLETADGIDKGAAVVSTSDLTADVSERSHAEPEVLLRVPQDMVLSLSLVEDYAKSDLYLREVLEGVGPFGKLEVPF